MNECMNESRSAVAHVPGVRVYCTGCGAVRGAKRLFLCRVVVVLWLGRCGGLTRKVGCLPRLPTSRSGAPGRTVGEVEDLRKDALVCTACGVSRVSLVRARAARASSEAAE